MIEQRDQLTRRNGALRSVEAQIQQTRRRSIEAPRAGRRRPVANHRPHRHLVLAVETLRPNQVDLVGHQLAGEQLVFAADDDRVGRGVDARNVARARRCSRHARRAARSCSCAMPACSPRRSPPVVDDGAVRVQIRAQPRRRLRGSRRPSTKQTSCDSVLSCTGKSEAARVRARRRFVELAQRQKQTLELRGRELRERVGLIFRRADCGRDARRRRRARCARSARSRRSARRDGRRTAPAFRA